MNIKVEVNVTDETSQIQLNIFTLPSSQNGYPTSSGSDTSSEPSHITSSRPNPRSRKNRRHSNDRSELSDESPIASSDITSVFNPTVIDPSNYQPSTAGDREFERDGDVEGTTLYEGETETESSLTSHADTESGDQPLPPHNSPVARSHIPQPGGLAALYEGPPEMTPADAHPSTHHHQQPESSSSVPQSNLSLNPLPRHPVMPPCIPRGGCSYGRRRRFATLGLGVPVLGGLRTVDERLQFMEPSFIEYVEEMSGLQERLVNTALGDEVIPPGCAGCVKCGKRGIGGDEVGWFSN